MCKRLHTMVPPQEKLADTKCMVSANYQLREACYSFAGTKCAAPVISQK